MKEDQQSNGAAIDPFLLKRVLPDAHEVFQFRPKPLDEAFQAAIFVLDTSALVVPYGVGKTSLDEIEKHYRDLVQAKRLVVPAHVAREFARQRARQIKDIFSALSKTRNQNPGPAPVYPVLVQMEGYEKLAASEKEILAGLATPVNEKRARPDHIWIRVVGYFALSAHEL